MLQEATVHGLHDINLQSADVFCPRLHGKRLFDGLIRPRHTTRAADVRGVYAIKGRKGHLARDERSGAEVPPFSRDARGRSRDQKH